jgi:hypothetical protein
VRRAALIALWLAGTLAAAVGLTAGALYVLTRPSLRVVSSWRQPEAVRYDGFDPYYLSVVEGDLDWRGLPFALRRRHFIYVGLESGKPTYGHMVDFTFYPFPDDLVTYVRQSTVEWSDEGVTFRPPSGHALFIPKRMFIGGR